MKICVVGLGYIGTPTAVTLAASGYDVYGYDINELNVKNIKEKNVPIKEYGLQGALLYVVDISKKLIVGQTIRDADVFIVTVSTPLDPQTKKINLSFLKQAIQEISQVLKNGNLVIIESTVTPGTTHNVVKTILDEVGKKYYLAFCPERVLPGNLMHELINNDRIIGGINPESTKKASEIYSRFIKGKLHETDALTAEMAKLMENTYRMVNIALANEMSLISEKYGGDIWKAIEMANNHPRVNIHLPGPGVGGYCLTKDPLFLIQDYAESQVIKSSIDVNNYMPYHIISILENIFNNNLSDKRIAVLGLAYKGNITDARESPGYTIYQILKNKNTKVRIHDPLVENYLNLDPEKDLDEILNWSDVVIITTDHDEYKHVDWKNFNGKIIDTKNIIKTFKKENIIKIGKS
jgi:UDP-N-acetyl-D-mannosaminuronic acid dehydrogenase